MSDASSRNVAGWYSLPNELRMQVLNLIDCASANAFAQASPADAANVRLRLRDEGLKWEARAASHPWLSVGAQSARAFILQAPRPSALGDSGGLRGKAAFRYIYDHEQKAQQAALDELRAYQHAEAEDTISIVPLEQDAHEQTLRQSYLALQLSLEQARGDDTMQVPDAFHAYMLRLGALVITFVSLHTVGAIDVSQPQAQVVCFALMMLAAIGLDAAPPPTV